MTPLCFTRDNSFIDLIYAGTKKWKAKHYALLNEGKVMTPYVLKPST